MLPFLLFVTGVLGGPVPPAGVVAARMSGLASCTLQSDLTAYEPGDVALVVATCDEAPTFFRARSRGATVPFFPVEVGPADGGLEHDHRPPATFAAVVGIDLAAPAGTTELTWSARLKGGAAAARGALLLRVAGRSFPVQRLRVAPRFAEPDSAALVRVAAERRRMERALATRSPERLWGGAFVSPVAGGSGRGFGARRVLNGRPSAPHTGLDIGAEEGAPVVASNAGVVVLADTLYLAGKTVVVDHGLGLLTTYSHLSQKSVLVGDRLERGQMLGRVGATGRVTGPHLHWAAHVNGARVDPLSLMAATAGRVRPLEIEPPAPGQD